MTTAAVLVLAVGGSRVYLGVHWPTDVFGGWSLGVAWLALGANSLLTTRLIISRKGRRRARQRTPNRAGPS